MLTLTLTLWAAQGSFVATHHSLLAQAPRGSGWLVAQDTEAPVPIGATPADPTLGRLRDEEKKLIDEMPGVGGFVAMTIIGIVCIAVGVPLFVASIFSYSLVAFIILGPVIAAAGVVVLLIGAINWGVRNGRRREQEARIEDVRRQIHQLESAPPPAPPPSSVERLRGPAPSLVLAQF
jgi:hypothetical protein